MAGNFGTGAGPSYSKNTPVFFGNSQSQSSLTSSISNGSQVQFRPHGAATGVLFGNPPTNPSPSNPSSNVEKPQFRPPGPVIMGPQQVHQRQTQWINPSLPRQSNQAKSPFSHGYMEKGENISPELPMKSLNNNAAKGIKSPHFPSGNSNNFMSSHFPSEDSKNIKFSPFPKGPSPHSLNYHPTSIDYKRSDVSPSRMGNARNPPFNKDSSPLQQRSRPVDYSDLHDEGTLTPPKPVSATPPKRSRSPPSVMLNSSHVQHNSEIIHRGDSSPPQQRSRLAVYSDLHDAGTFHPPKSSSATQLKRIRSPPAAAVTLSSSSIQNDTESEAQAKARRLARFNIELSPPKVHDYDLSSNKTSRYQHNSSLDKLDADGSADRTKVLGNIDDSINDDHLKSHARLVGLCPDMCPESEREERERKGDLDKYERLDGDRNQTNKFLAVKKYNRTAERDPDLIRPMPVLQKTVDYLLNLLNQPYDENFLSLYNFLWDRMRAIRMDLRMQHIFNQQSVIMLEQMIRLHIVAMHELCEYNKGEGFSEGFDAHLNIEQMNKTSVELFQIYDDHRKKGIIVPTEKEFRGYYALLKLDKHPGYKVEPAELSMDLAKMPPDIRCTREILFARDVARASRIGNYISFFRLARKATYLEACLMHAHFAKLRTQALASLHSGLQNNQGIPVKQVVYWLGMEDEDISSLLAYHGFGSKEYEEIYMVKEGPFLNGDVDFTTKRSPLVDMKKEARVIDDIYSGPSSEDIQSKSDVTIVDHISDARKAESLLKISNELKYDPAVKVNPVPKFQKPPEMESLPYLNGSANVHSEKNHDYRADSPLKTSFATPFSTLLEVHPSPFLNNATDADVTGSFFQRSTPLFINENVNYQEQDRDEQTIASFEKNEETIPLEDSSIDKAIGFESKVDMVQVVASTMPQYNSIPVEPAPPVVEDEHLDNAVQTLVLSQKNEISNEKLKAILRKWKLQAIKQRETREARILLANEALSSLSLGPPVRPSHIHPRKAQNKLNIDYVTRQRYERQDKSWSTLNASEVVGPILSERQPYAKCICWKLLVLNQIVDEIQNSYVSASNWLFSKLLGSPKENEKPIIYYPYLSIWKWSGRTESETQRTCCLAVTRVAMFDNNEQVSEDVIHGTTSIIFLVSESIPWATQRMRFQNLLSAIPSGSNLPLIVASVDHYNEEVADPSLAISSNLGLQNVDKTKISLFSVMFLYSNSPWEQYNGFFNDDELRECLRWLASHSPPQPSIHLMKTREVALSFLRYSQEQLENVDASQVSPHGCISSFNEALDRVVEEILTAASMSPNNWPGPEIDLLDKSHDEEVAIVDSLPHIGWSFNIQPVIDAIMNCKLPEFSFDISWLDQGSRTKLEIINRKRSLEECLARYLTDSCRLMDANFAVVEASMLLQTNTGLEFIDSYYYIKPRWLAIFRRIQHWRLNNLTAGNCSVAYFLGGHIDASPTPTTVSPGKSNTSTPYTEGKVALGQQAVYHISNKLSFDEILEYCFKAPLQSTEQSPSVSVPIRPSSVVNDGGCTSGTHVDGDGSGGGGGDDDNNDADDVICESADREHSRILNSFKTDNRLEILLEQCKRAQDMIAEKLALYS